MNFWTSIRAGTVPPQVRRLGFRAGLGTMFLAYLLAFAPPDYGWVDILNILPGTVAAILLYLSHGFHKDFLEPFRFSARLGRFMTERYGETRAESFRAELPRMQDWVRVQFRPEVQTRLFVAGLAGTAIGFAGMWSLFAYFKATVYNNYGGNFFLFFQLNIFVCAGFISAIALSETFRFIIRPRKLPEPPLTVDGIRNFREQYGDQGISTTLSFEEVYVNLIIYAKLARYFNYGFGNAEQIRFWQASLLYLHLSIQTLDENDFTIAIRRTMHMLDEKELGLPGLSDGSYAGSEHIKAFATYWEKAGFSTAAHPYLAYIPGEWRRVWMASVSQSSTSNLAEAQQSAQGSSEQSAAEHPSTSHKQGVNSGANAQTSKENQKDEAQTKVTVRYGRQVDDSYIQDYLERFGPKK